jgi:hypothetical protein
LNKKETMVEETRRKKQDRSLKKWYKFSKCQGAVVMNIRKHEQWDPDHERSSMQCFWLKYGHWMCALMQERLLGEGA